VLSEKSQFTAMSKAVKGHGIFVMSALLPAYEVIDKGWAFKPLAVGQTPPNVRVATELMAEQCYGHRFSSTISILDASLGIPERTESIRLRQGQKASGYNCGPRKPPLARYA